MQLKMALVLSGPHVLSADIPKKKTTKNKQRITRESLGTLFNAVVLLLAR